MNAAAKAAGATYPCTVAGACGMILVAITVLAVVIDSLVVARTHRTLSDEPPVDPNAVTTDRIVVDLSRRP